MGGSTPSGTIMCSYDADDVKACSAAPVSKTGQPHCLLNLAKRGFSKLDPCILAGSGFETGAAKRALTCTDNAADLQTAVPIPVDLQPSFGTVLKTLVLSYCHVVPSQAVTLFIRIFDGSYDSHDGLKVPGHLMPSSLSLAKSNATMKTPTVAPPFYKALKGAQGHRPLFTFLPEKSVVRTVR